MNAKELFDTAQLSAAIAQLNQELRSHPSDLHRRTFLFELLCFAGDYQRAERQLDIIGHQSAPAEVGVQVYRNILAAEEARRRLFVEGVPPHFLLEPPSYVHLHLAAVNRLRENQPDEAKALLDESENSRPRIKGQLDERTFFDFRDADDVIGPCLELIIHSHYIWLPFEQVKRLTISRPKRLRALLWIPGTLEACDGSAESVFMPVLYAASSQHSDDRVRLGRMTDWKAVGEGLALGVGQRLFLVDGEERAMLEVREVEFEAGANGS